VQGSVGEQIPDQINQPDSGSDPEFRVGSIELAPSLVDTSWREKMSTISPRKRRQYTPEYRAED
jgi:hypothetical protein